MRESKSGWVENKLKNPPAFPEIFNVASAGCPSSLTTPKLDFSFSSAAIMLCLPERAAPPSSARNSRRLEKEATTIITENCLKQIEDEKNRPLVPRT